MVALARALVRLPERASRRGRARGDRLARADPAGTGTRDGVQQSLADPHEQGGSRGRPSHGARARSSSRSASTSSRYSAKHSPIPVRSSSCRELRRGGRSSNEASNWHRMQGSRVSPGARSVLSSGRQPAAARTRTSTAISRPASTTAASASSIFGGTTCSHSAHAATSTRAIGPRLSVPLSSFCAAAASRRASSHWSCWGWSGPGAAIPSRRDPWMRRSHSPYRRGELQHIAPVAAARAEAAWLAGDPHAVVEATETALELAERCKDPWLTGELHDWRRRAGVREDTPAGRRRAVRRPDRRRVGSRCSAVVGHRLPLRSCARARRGRRGRRAPRVAGRAAAARCRPGRHDRRAPPARARCAQGATRATAQDTAKSRQPDLPRGGGARAGRRKGSTTRRLPGACSSPRKPSTTMSRRSSGSSAYARAGRRAPRLSGLGSPAKMGKARRTTWGSRPMPE